MVLPEPVGALPQTSRPARASRERRGLHGEGFGDAEHVEALAQAGGDAEVGKGGGHVGGFSCIEGAGTRTLEVGRSALADLGSSAAIRTLLLGGSLKPQLDTARQRLLAPEHCTGPRSPNPPLGSAAMEPVMARKMWRTLEPYHGLIYFAPEATAAYEALGVDGLRRLLRLAGRAHGRGAGRGGRSPPSSTSTPAIVHHAIPAAWERHHAGGAARGALRRAADAALRRAARRRPRRLRRIARAAELARVRRRGVHRRRSTALRRPRRAAVARSSRTSRCGTRSRCSASSAATVTSPAWSTPASTASTRWSSTPRRARSRAPRCRRSPPVGRRGVGRVGRPPRRRGAASTTAVPSPRPAPRSASTSRTAPTRWPCAAWEALGEDGCDELRSLVRPLSKAIVGERHLRVPANYKGVTCERMAVLRFSYGTMGSGKSTARPADPPQPVEPGPPRAALHPARPRRRAWCPPGSACRPPPSTSARSSTSSSSLRSYADDQRRPRLPRVRRGAVLHTRPGRAAGPRGRRARRRRPRPRPAHRLPRAGSSTARPGSSSWPTSGRSSRSRRAAGAAPGPPRTPGS